MNRHIYPESLRNDLLEMKLLACDKLKNVFFNILGPRFYIFLAVGLATAIVQFVAFYLMFDVLHAPRRISVSISYIIAVAFHFNANRIITFRAASRDLGKRMFRYAAITVLNYFITIIVVDICVNSAGLSPYIGLMASIATTVMTGFLLMKYWVFV
jgi:putative flippase GtrA